MTVEEADDGLINIIVSIADGSLSVWVVHGKVGPFVIKPDEARRVEGVCEAEAACTNIELFEEGSTRVLGTNLVEPLGLPLVGGADVIKGREHVTRGGSVLLRIARGIKVAEVLLVTDRVAWVFEENKPLAGALAGVRLNRCARVRGDYIVGVKILVEGTVFLEDIKAGRHGGAGGGGEPRSVVRFTPRAPSAKTDQTLGWGGGPGKGPHAVGPSACEGQVAFLVGLISTAGLSNRADVAERDDLAGRFAGFAKGRKQQADQERDDGDDDQKLNEGKA